MAGLCSCDAGFAGADCSVDTKAPPVIQNIADSGNCDLASTDTCDCFSVSAYGLVEGFMCYISTDVVNFRHLVN